jgi:hypothetical protein
MNSKKEENAGTTSKAVCGKMNQMAMSIQQKLAGVAALVSTDGTRAAGKHSETLGRIIFMNEAFTEAQINALSFLLCRAIKRRGEKTFTWLRKHNIRGEKAKAVMEVVYHKARNKYLSGFRPRWWREVAHENSVV